MWETLAALLAKVLAAVALVVLGEERQRRKKAEADADTLRKHAAIDRQPDVEHPFGRLRDE